MKREILKSYVKLYFPDLLYLFDIPLLTEQDHELLEEALFSRVTFEENWEPTKAGQEAELMMDYKFEVFGLSSE